MAHLNNIEYSTISRCTWHDEEFDTLQEALRHVLKYDGCEIIYEGEILCVEELNQ